MPVNTTHKQYQEREGQWLRCRDAIAGQDAVHERGQAYLPKLSEQTATEYASYVGRTPWYGATGRTLDGMVGMVFRSAPVLEAPEALIAYTKDITLSGVTLDGLARETLQEVLGIGRFGLLVEYPQRLEGPMTLAQATDQNIRPYVTAYLAEHILNWRLERVNNRMQPTMVVLQETYEEKVDEWTTEEKPQVRELLLEGGRYVQRVYRDVKDADGEGGWEQFGPDIVPTMNGRPLPEIPFYPFGPEVLGMQVQQSPILDLVDLNLSHYRTSADLEHGAHFTGLPTPFIAGVQLQEGAKVKIGSSEAIVSPDPQASASYLEFSGSGLGALEKLMDRKESQMAALGARMLAPDKTGVEAAETLSIRQNGENSVLAGIANLVAYGFTEMLAFMARWAGINGEVSYRLNRDYLPRGMSGQELTALVSSWQQGAISFQTMFQNLQRAEVIAPDVTVEEEEVRIGTAAPTLAMQTAAKPNPDDPDAE